MLERLVRNWPLKLLALGLAFVIWIAVTGENRIVRDVRVPLVVQLQDDLILAGTPVSAVTVRLRGAETALRRAELYALELPLDLREAGPGERKVQLSSDALKGLPGDVEVDRIIPDWITLKVDRRARRLLPVVPSFTGKPPKGYAFYAAQATPDAVDVDGPESEVAALRRLRTDSIRLNDRIAPFVARVSAVPDSLEVRVVDPRPIEVRVEVDVAPVETVFESVPVVLADRAYDTIAYPRAVKVVLSGPPDVLRTIRPMQVRAVADIAGLAPRAEAYEVPLRVDLLDVPATDLTRVTVKSVSRSKVAVRVSGRRVAT